MVISPFVCMFLHVIQNVFSSSLCILVSDKCRFSLFYSVCIYLCSSTSSNSSSSSSSSTGSSSSVSTGSSSNSSNSSSTGSSSSI